MDDSERYANCKTGADANTDEDCAASRRRVSLEQYWDEDAARAGRTPSSRRPRSTTFSGAVQTGCGQASSQVGPFYCPPDQQIYLDTTFFDDVLEGQLGGQGGDFVEPYVLGPRVRPPHPEPARHHGPGPHAEGSRVRRRPPRAPGRLLRRHVDQGRQRRRRPAREGSTRATSTRRSTPPRPSVTTASSSSRARASTPRAGRTARRSSGRAWFMTGATARARSQACDTFSASDL